MAKTRTVSRSAKTGKFVRDSFAKKHPGTTVLNEYCCIQKETDAVG